MFRRGPYCPKWTMPLKEVASLLQNYLLSSFAALTLLFLTAVFMKVATSTFHLGHVTRSKIVLRSRDTAFRSCD